MTVHEAYNARSRPWKLFSLHITALHSDTTTTAACTSRIPFSFHSYLKTILLLHSLRYPTWARSTRPQRPSLLQASTTAQRAARYTAATMGSITPAEVDAEAVIANGSVERPLGPPAIQKLNGWQLFEKMGRPKFVVAPMVDQSELAWRILSRLHGASIAYTPMIHSALFATESNQRYRTDLFDLLSGEEGHTQLDRPLVAQFCSNNKDTFLKAATIIAESGQVDAVDLNLGCPQGIAKRGNYGAFLMEDWTTISGMITHMHQHLPVPITAKFRVYDSLEKTLEYAKMLESSGAQILTVHGRTRDQKGHNTGLADWAKIKAVKQLVKVPVFANGNILSAHDLQKCLEETGVDGIMSAEGNLYNPALFEPLNRSSIVTYRASLPTELQAALDAIDSKYTPHSEAAYYPISQLSRQYLAIVRNLKTRTATSAIKAHLFKLWKPLLTVERYFEFRDRMADNRGNGLSDQKEVWLNILMNYEKLVDEANEKLKEDFAQGLLKYDPNAVLAFSHDVSDVPYSHAQAYIRPLTNADAEKVMKRSLSEVAKDDEQLDMGSMDAKKVRLGSPTGDIQLVQPTIPCPACNSNTASARCGRGTCKKCCLEAHAREEASFKESQSSGKGEDVEFIPKCEMHLDKMKKEQEKRDKLKAHREAKKKRAKEIQMNEQSRKAAKKELQKQQQQQPSNGENEKTVNGSGVQNGLIDTQPSVATRM